MSRLLIAGEWKAGESVDTLSDRFDGRAFGEMQVASAEQVNRAVSGAQDAFTNDAQSPYERYRILMEASRLLAGRRDELIATMRNEAGFTRADGENEVNRCIQTLELSAEEAKRLNGELIPMLAASGARDRIGFTIRAPRGVVCAITPFNSPLNTPAHKIGPALAAGNAVILKPASYTPLSAVILCEVLLEAGLTPGLLSLLHGPGGRIGQQLLEDQRIAYYAFTGSTQVGRRIQAAAGLRGTQLELGSIASTIVCDDADIDRAIPKILSAGFRKAGQVCTSVQRLLVDRAIHDAFTARLIEAAAELKYGDPSDPDTVIGPMISLEHAKRAESWVAEAADAGAKILIGGTRSGSVMAPTVLTDVDARMKVVCDEIFAPVLSIIPFATLDEAVGLANASPFGLAAGLFTANLHRALRVSQALRFGGVHVNEASSARVDVMPFGGVKESGFGREGPAYAVREMTEERLITISY